MTEKPRILALDLLETFAREQDVAVQIERRQGKSRWDCVLVVNGGNHQIFRGSGETARQAILAALHGAGVKTPG